MEEIKHEDRAAGMTLKELLLQKRAAPEEIETLETRINILEKENKDLKAKLKLTSNTNEKNILYSDSLLKKAVKALKQENPLDAMGFLQAVLVLEPENIKAMNNLAVVYWELGYEERALETIDNVLNKDPENETARKNLEILSENHEEEQP